MKQLLFFVLTLTSLSAFPAGHHVVKTYVLDDQNVYVLHIPKPNEGVTTITFPGEITALQGNNVSLVPNGNARYLIDYSSGQNYFSLISTGRGETNLNVIYRGHTYVLELQSTDDPDFAVNFVHDTLGTLSAGDSTLRLTHEPLATPILIGLLDKAKALPVLARDNPDILSQVAVYQPNRVMYYNGFQVSIDKVYRFESEDTLIFELTLINQTASAINYLPNNFAARVGNRVFTQSISEASGLMPAGHNITDLRGVPVLDAKGQPTFQPSETKAWFAITGDDKGNRNNLRADNFWNVLVTRADDDHLRQIASIESVSDDMSGPGEVSDPKRLEK